jgi:hypothetical protein
MEIQPFLRIECRDTAQRDFVQLMLRAEEDRPLFAEDVPRGQRAWFTALEELATAEWVQPEGETALYALMPVLGLEVSEDMCDLLNCLRAAKVVDVFALISDDEGYHELWVLREGKLERYDKWQGKSLKRWCAGKHGLDNLSALLARMRG